ncbi:MAG TPA: AEC family transporter [bacterium]|nr:AEC family transporter [bacterium]
MLGIITEVIGPVLLITAVGYALGRSRLVVAQPLTALSALVLIPALVFYALTTSTLPRAAFARIGSFIVVQFLLVAFVVWVFARLHRWERVRIAGVLLATQISNAGNAGLPLVFFAWGQMGLTSAVGYFAVQAVLVNLLAVYIGAGATSSGAHPAQALLRQPVTYAIGAGVLLNLLGIGLLVPIAKAAQLLANGAIAIMLLVVGVQLAEVRVAADLHTVWFAVVVRLLVAPLLAWTTAPLLGLEGALRDVSILLASLPTGVSAAVWATEFRTEPGLVSSIVVITTLLSPVTITGLLLLLR